MKFDVSNRSVSMVFSLWVTFFCFTTVMGLLFQKLLLPSIPSMHAGFGLMNNDAIYFHHVAEAMASEIQITGWTWSAVWPDAMGAKGNVAVLAILYALFGVDPSLIIPINAVMHATSGIILMFIVQLLCPGYVGRISGIIAATLFVVLPSSLNWYAQVHKDGYVILGTLLVLYAWLHFFMYYKSKRAIAFFIVSSFIGIAFIIFARPYNAFFLVVATAAWLLAAGLFAMVGSSMRRRRRYFFVSGLVWLMFVVITALYADAVAQGFNAYSKWSGTGAGTEKACLEWQWKHSAWLPDDLEKHVEKIAKTRAGLMCANFDASSNVDREHLPSSIVEVAAYMPRAMMVSLLAPFPDMWFSPLSMSRLVGALETLIWYLLIPGVFMAIRRYGSKGLMLCLLFAFCYLAIYGFAIGNIGTLHRVRYPFLSLLLAVGVLGWVGLITQSRIFKARADKHSHAEEVNAVSAVSVMDGDNEHVKVDQKSVLRNKVGKGGMLVSVVTLLSFVGFFVRDILMAQKFGIGGQMDAFYIAMLVPMFLVNVFGQSFGATSTSIYMRAYHKSEQHAATVVQHLAYMATIFLLVVSVLLAMLSPIILPVLGWGFNEETIKLTHGLLYGVLPLLLFSGMVVLGNAVLSARMRFLVPAWSQAVVPVFAIGALLTLGSELGVYAVLVGMVIGQLANLILVQLYLRRDHLGVMPKRADSSITILPKESKQQFMALILATVFLQISLLIDNGMASSLEVGSVASLGLGYKAVFFVTGVIGAGISMALLPYFVNFVVKQDMVSANRELSMLMSLATMLGIIVSLIVYFIAPHAMQLFFSGGMVSVQDIDAVIRVIRMAIIQAPFFACQLILIKYATAVHDNRSILTASIVGVIVNVVLNYMLMQRMGVGGIAAATTLSMFCSAVVLLWMVHRQGNISRLDVLLSGLVWMLFLTMMLCIHFQSYSGIVASVIAMFLAAFILNSDKELLNYKSA